jgi:hypothetical protein
MKRNLTIAAATAIAAVTAGTAAYADSISSVEGARARERAGYYLSPQDRSLLRTYGSNDDYGYYNRGYWGGYYDGGYGPGVAVVVGPRPYYWGY